MTGGIVIARPKPGDDENVVLATQTEAADDGPITLDVVVPDVVQETATPTDQLQQPSSGVMVALVHFEVLGEMRDALGEDRDLHLG
jgi:hypothetical protein